MGVLLIVPVAKELEIQYAWMESVSSQDLYPTSDHRLWAFAGSAVKG